VWLVGRHSFLTGKHERQDNAGCKSRKKRELKRRITIKIRIQIKITIQSRTFMTNGSRRIEFYSYS
jgi:hypothetical protein